MLAWFQMRRAKLQRREGLGRLSPASSIRSAYKRNMIRTSIFMNNVNNFCWIELRLKLCYVLAISDSI